MKVMIEDKKMGPSVLFSSKESTSSNSSSSIHVDFLLLFALMAFVVSVRWEVTRLIKRIRARKGSKRGTFLFYLMHMLL